MKLDLSFIKQERTRRELTLKELSTFSGVSTDVISRLENNDQSTMTKLKDIAAICNVLDFEIVAKDKINKHKPPYQLI